MSANEDAGPNGVDCEIPHQLGRRTKHSCGNLPSKRVLKTLRGSPKAKTQRTQYLLTMDVGSLQNFMYIDIGFELLISLLL